MAECPLPPARARGCWSSGETAALVDAWAPLYQRRRTGESDVWVPLHLRGLVRGSRALVAVDWRAVAFAVNAYRANAGLGSVRTHQQCKLRVRTLKDLYKKELAAPSGWRFFDVLDAIWGGEVWSRKAAAVAGRRAAAGDEGAATADDAHGGAAAEEDGAAAKAHGGAAAIDGGTNMVDASVGVALDEDIAAAGDARGAAAVDLLGGPIPKRPRTGVSTPAGAGRESPVKEELVQQARARARSANEGRRGEAGNARGGAPAEGLAATVAGMLDDVAHTSGASAVVSTAAAAVMRVAEMCEHVMVKSLEVDRGRAAAAARGI